MPNLQWISSQHLLKDQAPRNPMEDASSKDSFMSHRKSQASALVEKFLQA